MMLFSLMKVVVNDGGGGGKNGNGGSQGPKTGLIIYKRDRDTHVTNRASL